MPFNIGQTKLRFDENGDPFYLRTISKDGTTEKVLPENMKIPMLKELIVKVALKRSGYSPEMEKRTWYGIQTLKISIPIEKRYRYYYLVFDPKAMSSVVVKVVIPTAIDEFSNYNSISWNFNVQPSRDSKEFDWVRKVGKVETVSSLKVQSLLQNKEILGVLSDEGIQAF